MSTRRSTALALSTALLCGEGAGAEESPPRREIAVDLRIDLPVVAASVAFLGATQFSLTPIGLQHCNMCESLETLNAFDSWAYQQVRGADHERAHLASNVLAFGAAPAVALGLALAASLDASRALPRRARARRYGIDVLIMTEAVFTSLSVMQVMRITTQRNRPYTLDNPPSNQTRPDDDNLSFPSGHAMLAFAAVSSAGMLSSIRRQRLAPLVWVGGLTIASAASILRWPSDRHYATDIIVGGSVGTIIGTLVPLLHARRAPVRIGGGVYAQGGMVTVFGAL